MKDEIEQSLKSQVDAKIANIPAESLLPVPDEATISTLLATSGGYSKTEPGDLNEEIKTDIRLAMDSKTPEERVNNLEAITRAMAAEQRVGDNERTAFTEEIQNHLKTMSTVPATPDTAGESFIKAMMHNLKDPTQSQVKVLDQLLSSINDVRFDEGLIPDVIDLLTNPDKVKAMPDSERIKFEERAGDALAQLSFLVGDRLTEEQYSDFDKITRKLQKPKC
jgi:tRNA A37 N6-isopentenylltransferase MiaA